MITTARFTAACLVLFSAAANAQQHRELGAHQHGHGTLNIAVDGEAISMELEVPGADIVGFEHEASTAQEKSALEKAKATLAAPLEVFKVPQAANCAVKTAKIDVEEEDHDHEHGKENAESGKTEAHHTAFHVEYLLSCGAPAKLTSMTFDYFKAFANAQALTVEVISPKAQTKFEATREKPVIDLSGLM